MNEDILSRLSRIEEKLALLTHGEDDILVSCTEASRLLGKTKTTISTMIRERRLNKVTIGESTGILLSEIRKINAQ